MKGEVWSSTSVDKREVLEGGRLVGLFSMLLPFALLLALVLFSLSPCDDGIFKLSDASVCGLFLSVSIVAVRARSGVRGRGFDPSFWLAIAAMVLLVFGYWREPVVYIASACLMVAAFLLVRGMLLVIKNLFARRCRAHSDARALKVPAAVCLAVLAALDFLGIERLHGFACFPGDGSEARTAVALGACLMTIAGACLLGRIEREMAAPSCFRVDTAGTKMLTTKGSSSCKRKRSHTVVHNLLERLDASFSPRENRVAELILLGESMNDIARRLGLSKAAVGTYAVRVYRKSGVENRAEFYGLAQSYAESVEEGSALGHDEEPGDGGVSDGLFSGTSFLHDARMAIGELAGLAATCLFAHLFLTLIASLCGMAVPCQVLWPQTILLLPLFTLLGFIGTSFALNRVVHTLIARPLCIQGSIRAAVAGARRSFKATAVLLMPTPVLVLGYLVFLERSTFVAFVVECGLSCAALLALGLGLIVAAIGLPALSTARLGPSCTYVVVGLTMLALQLSGPILVVEALLAVALLMAASLLGGYAPREVLSNPEGHFFLAPHQALAALSLGSLFWGGADILPGSLRLIWMTLNASLLCVWMMKAGVRLDAEGILVATPVLAALALGAVAVSALLAWTARIFVTEAPFCFILTVAVSWRILFQYLADCERRKALLTDLDRDVLDRALFNEGLTEQERRIALLAARGLTARQMADDCHVSKCTVYTHIRHIYAKLSVHDRVSLAAKVDDVYRAEVDRT